VPVTHSKFATMLRYFTMILLVLVLGFSQTPPSYAQAPATSGPILGIDFSGGKEWFNVSRPLVSKDFQGRVLVLDFWTYACINCIHQIPELKKLEQHFGDKIAVVGVHSAKFPNEKDSEQIARAIARYGIQHPVLNDANYAVWQRYRAQGWPTIAILNTEGELRFHAAGEISFEIMRNAVDGVLKEQKAPQNPVPLPLALSKKAYSTGALAFPAKMVASQSSYFVANPGKNQILEFDFKGKIKRTFGSPAPGFTDGSGDTAQFRSPQGLCLRNNNKELAVADTDNHAVRSIDLTTGVTSTLFSEGNEPGSAMKRNDMRSPWAVACVDDVLYIAMAGTHQLGKLALEGKTWKYSIAVGSGDEGIGDGLAANATLAQPSALQFDLQKNLLYFIDSETSSLRVLDMKSREVSTLIGKGLFDFGKVDGDKGKARMQHPLDISLLPNGNLIIADSFNHALRLFDIPTQKLSTIPTSVKLEEPAGVMVSGNKIFVSSTNAHQIYVGELSQLEHALSGIKPLELSEFPEADSQNTRTFLPNKDTVKSDKLKLLLGETFTLRFKISLPNGQKFNEQFPASVVLPGGKRLGWFPGVHDEMTIETTGMKGGDAEIAATFAYCPKENPTSCKLRSVVWPVTLDSKKGAKSIVLEYQEK
jgi:thiol-disulfide isomerase/thioredoxin